MLTTIHNIGSLFRIMRILAKHQALFIFEPLRFYPLIRLYGRIVYKQPKHKKMVRRSQRLANALVEMGPTFIKLGQVLSTRSDLIGELFARDLALLQDKLPPFPSDIAVRKIETAFEKSLDELFTSFEKDPVAAASMAQVHFAVTTEGKDVAVKILRPDVEKRFMRDVAMFGWLASLVDRFIPEARRMRPMEMVETMRQSVKLELDLRYEAASAVELKANMASEAGFYVPDIDWQRTSNDVLTLERIYGVPGNDVQAVIDAGHNVDEILFHAANAFFVQVFRDGFFHADMHPGNLFILDDGRIAVVDFGIMGRLDYENRVFLAQVLSGFLREDYYLVAKVHADFGIIPPDKSVDEFAMACMAIGKPILDKNLSEISVARLLAQLFQVSRTFEMRLQPQLLLLQKTMMLAEGIGRSLNPDVNMWKMSEPLIMTWYQQNLSAPAMALARAKRAKEQLNKLPETLELVNSTLQRLADGKLVLDERSFNMLDQNRRRVRWLTAALFVITLVLVFTQMS